MSEPTDFGDPSNPNDSNDARRVIREPWEVRIALQRIGITMELLDTASKAWVGAWASATEFEPAYAGGIKGYIAANGVLREGTSRFLGWQLVNYRNVPLTQDKEGNYGIVVTSGDENVGERGPGRPEPLTRNPKGVTTDDFIEQNQKQLILPTMEDAVRMIAEAARRAKRRGKVVPIRDDEHPDEKPLAKSIYFLLIYIGDGKIQRELSMPVDTNEDGRVSDWKVAILLPPIESELARRKKGDVPPGNDDSGGEELNVPVSRKL